MIYIHRALTRSPLQIMRGLKIFYNVPLGINNLKIVCNFLLDLVREWFRAASEFLPHFTVFGPPSNGEWSFGLVRIWKHTFL